VSFPEATPPPPLGDFHPPDPLCPHLQIQRLWDVVFWLMLLVVKMEILFSAGVVVISH